MPKGVFSGRTAYVGYPSLMVSHNPRIWRGVEKWSLYTFINRISWTTLLLIQRVTCCGKEGMMTFWIVGALRRVFEDFKSGVCITSVPMYKLKSA